MKRLERVYNNGDFSVLLTSATISPTSTFLAWLTYCRNLPQAPLSGISDACKRKGPCFPLLFADFPLIVASYGHHTTWVLVQRLRGSYRIRQILLRPKAAADPGAYLLAIWDMIPNIMSHNSTPPQPLEKPVRKTRARTGCLTCRQRRIKCDETKPDCQRCQKANIVCEGYQSKRRLNPKSNRNSLENQSRDQSPSSQDAFRIGSSSPFGNSGTADVYPSTLLGQSHDSLPDFPLHTQALDVSAHYQYTLQTCGLLFSHDHLYFWRDHLVSLAWKIECLFDVIVAIGGINKALILANDPNRQQDAVHSKKAATRACERARLGAPASQQQELWKETCPEILTALPLLLAYFEVCALQPHTPIYA